MPDHQHIAASDKLMLVNDRAAFYIVV